jgi:hypothetical protein
MLIIWPAFACSPTCTPPIGNSWSPRPWSQKSGTSWLVKPGLRSRLFLQSLADGDFSTVELTTSDYARMAELVVNYDLPLGTTDASVVAIAERLKLTEVATLDHRR